VAERWYPAFILIVLFGAMIYALHADLSQPTQPPAMSSQQPNSIEEQAEANRKRYEIYEKSTVERNLTVYTGWLAITTVALAVVAAVQAGLFLWQLGLMREGITDAKEAAIASKGTADSLLASNRAFVYVHRQMYGEIPGPRYWIGPEWGNSGNTPTKEMRTHVRCELLDFLLSDDFDFDYPTTEIHAAFLGPRTTIMGARLPIEGLTQAELIAIQNKTKFLYLMGWVRYHDIFANTPEHMTRFCYQVDVAGDVQGQFSVLFNPHPRNNCADEGCKESERA
jgi:hypothetical protein